MIPVNEPLLAGNEKAYLCDCAETAWISSAGKYIDRFEAEWATYCGRDYGVAVCNGTVALQLAIAALNLPSGSEVLVPSFTILSCVEAILWNDLTPILTDCDPDTFCMDMNHAESRITERTAAILAVDIYGHPVNVTEMLTLAKRHNLRIIEDAAEAHGAECLVGGEWRRCGSFGDLSTFSFYANKNITCGEGGMVLTDSLELAQELRAKRNLCFGSNERFKHEARGFNFRMTNMQAAVGCAQLERIDEILERKRQMSERYTNGLRGLPLRTPSVKEWAHSSVWMYAIQVKEEAGMSAVEFAARLQEKGIQSRPFFRGMHTQPCYHKLGLFIDESYPITEQIYSQGLYLPSGQAITDDQIDTVIEACKEIF